MHKPKKSMNSLHLDTYTKNEENNKTPFKEISLNNKYNKEIEKIKLQKTIKIFFLKKQRKKKTKQFLVIIILIQHLLNKSKIIKYLYLMIYFNCLFNIFVIV